MEMRNIAKPSSPSALPSQLDGGHSPRSEHRKEFDYSLGIYQSIGRFHLDIIAPVCVAHRNDRQGFANSMLISTLFPPRPLYLRPRMFRHPLNKFTPSKMLWER